MQNSLAKLQKLCRCCGERFESADQNQKYCSEDCDLIMKERKLLSSTRWRERNPTQMKDYARAYRKKNGKKMAERDRKRRQLNPEKTRASAYAHYHKLKGPECEFCGSIENIGTHHPDYNFKNIIVTCCAKCHRWIEDVPMDEYWKGLKEFEDLQKYSGD